jgi:hypothetical protein
MHKYAAATALAIAIITGLALAVSASLTPANARSIYSLQCGPRTHSGIICTGKCETELWYSAELWDGTRNLRWSCPPLLQACVTTCVKEGRAWWIPNYSEGRNDSRH